MIKILVIEDDLEIQKSLNAFLGETGYEVSSAYDGSEAMKLFDESINLVILDIMLPVLDGFSVCKNIRKISNTPIIMLSALNDEQNQIQGFDLQIDDYITKPFSVPILLGKIKAVLRRTGDVHKSEYINYKELKIDCIGMKVYFKDILLELTTKEFLIILELFSHIGVVITRDVLFEKLWGMDFFYDDSVINTHMRNIRKKLGVDYIQTVRGAGYIVEKEI